MENDSEINHDTSAKQKNKTKHVLNSLIFGSASSSVSILLYQPLDLLKTRLQLPIEQKDKQKILGKSTKFIKHLTKKHGVFYLWRGTGASLLRSIPGVGLYYSFLQILQQNFSNFDSKPDNSLQAFFFGITARSAVSLALMPVTITKVHYEIGKIEHPNIFKAVKEVCIRHGWLGSTPTVLRDSLFSGTYYMCYTKLKNFHSTKYRQEDAKYNFLYGLLSGITASIVTNPIDVIKTRIQIATSVDRSMSQAAKTVRFENGLGNFFLGLGPRILRRTLVAATTWTLYEYFMQKL